ncbi:MAG: aminopeptidase [Acidobacteriota bacterium]
MTIRSNDDIERFPLDPELLPGASNAVRQCLRIQPHERVTLITDEASLAICRALADQIREVGSHYRLFVLEDHAERPLQHMPEAVLSSMESSQVSLFAAQAGPGELGARMEMMVIVNRLKLRHAHMVNISKEIMMQGMRADFRAVDLLSSQLIERARKAAKIKATSTAGTDLVAEFSPHLCWIKTSGLIGTDKWGNLPGGEIFTSPLQVNGVFAVDGVVGDYLCSRYGDLRETPLQIEISDGRIRHLSCENEELLDHFTDYTSVDSNSNRVGEFAIGTNLWVKDVIGNILQDEKIPGVHIAFGHPYSEHTGQDWTSSTHIDCVGRCFDVWMDEAQVMKEGQFLLS